MIEAWLEKTVDYVWGTPLALGLVGAGLILTFYMGGIQWRGFLHAIKVIRGTYDRKDDPGEITHFQALSTALSATVGLGNIAGVAVAIQTGGPGALMSNISPALMSNISLALILRINKERE